MKKNKMAKIVWVLVNTHNLKEARKIGQAILKKRLAACYGMFKKMENIYFWPPRTNHLEKNTGPTLVFDTLPKIFTKISSVVKKLHSDKLPFIGQIEIKVEKEFYNWVKGDIV